MSSDRFSRAACISLTSRGCSSYSVIDVQHEQTIIYNHGGRLLGVCGLSTSKPDHGRPLLVASCCALWQPLAARTEARLLLRARRLWLSLECTYSSGCWLVSVRLPCAKV